MTRITEEDVIKSYMSHVVQACEKSYKGMELEDRLMEGRIALLHAIRTYKTQYGCFEEYMLQQLRTIMKQRNKEAWAIRRPESHFSLDALQVREDGSSSFVLSQCLGATHQDDTIFDVACFVEGLSLIERKILFYLMDDNNITQLSNKLELSVFEIQIVLKRLQSKAATYFGIAST